MSAISSDLIYVATVQWLCCGIVTYSTASCSTGVAHKAFEHDIHALYE